MVFNVSQCDLSQSMFCEHVKKKPGQFGDERALRSSSSDRTFKAIVS